MKTWSAGFIYAITLLATIALFMAIRAQGETLQPLSTNARLESHSVATEHGGDAMPHLLLALAVVILTAHLAGGLFRRFHQAPVVGEVLGGILLGPSLLGQFAPEVMAYVFPSSVIPFLGLFAQIGVVLFMFLIGLEIDLDVIRNSGQTTVLVSHMSIVLPFVLGTLLAFGIYVPFSYTNVSFTSFALFLGVSMSITAFPVLARILSDRAISKTRMGMITLACAAIDDVTAWCLLAFVISVVRSNTGHILFTVLNTILYIAAMVGLVRPWLSRVVLPRLESEKGVSSRGMAILFVALLLSALLTEWIGIHAIFGAFLFGAIIPDKSQIAVQIQERLRDFVAVFLLPAFFIVTGLKTQLNLLDDAKAWLVCGLVIAVATAGKFGGTLIAARLSGFGWRDSAGLGILMNTRGLVELIVLNVGLELGVISPTLFTILVVMALVTTFMTTPIFDWLTRKAPWHLHQLN